jgi:hypothetical protein
MYEQRNIGNIIQAKLRILHKKKEKEINQEDGENNKPVI